MRAARGMRRHRPERVTAAVGRSWCSRRSGGAPSGMAPAAGSARRGRWRLSCSNSAAVAIPLRRICRRRRSCRSCSSAPRRDFQLVGRDVHHPSHHHRQRAHALGMAGGVGIACVERRGEGADRAEIGRPCLGLGRAEPAHQVVERRGQRVEFPACPGWIERASEVARRRHGGDFARDAVDGLDQLAREPQASDGRQHEAAPGDHGQRVQRRLCRLVRGAAISACIPAPARGREGAEHRHPACGCWPIARAGEIARDCVRHRAGDDRSAHGYLTTARDSSTAPARSGVGFGPRRVRQRAIAEHQARGGDRAPDGSTARPRRVGLVPAGTRTSSPAGQRPASGPLVRSGRQRPPADSSVFRRQLRGFAGRLELLVDEPLNRRHE